MAAEQDTYVSGKHRIVGGRYILEQELGRGGMGTVWKASQMGVGNVVAIKFLNDVLSGDPALVKRFEQEAKVSLEVAHPGAAQLLDTGKDPKTNQLYIVFEFVDGEDLRARLMREGALSFEEVRDIALRVGEVLAAAHARGIVHRDIKPENIRLRSDLGGTHVKVLDFGIARFRPEQNARITAEGAIAGTPAYMAPEQVRAETVDGRADIYALGLVTYEMATGLPAFLASSPAALLVDQLSTPLPPLAARAPHRDFPALDAILQRACAKDPAQRFESAKAFVEAIKALPPPPWAAFTGSAPGAPAVLATDAAVPTSGPRTGLWLAGLVGVGVALGLGGFLATRSGRSVSTCTELFPELRELSTNELEARLRKTRLAAPSRTAQLLAGLEATAAQGPESERECRYRVSVMGALAAAPTTLASTPELWGQTREAKELELLFLEMPLNRRWTVAQRRDVLEQVDHQLAKQGAPADDAPWLRREALGVLLTCSAADEALEQLKIGRPRACPELTPRQ